MKIEVLGTGCYDCIKLETLIGETLSKLGKTDVEIKRISDEKQICRFMPLDETPGLVINGVLVNCGSLPDNKMLETWLSEAL
jgi:hypothetical protein